MAAKKPATPPSVPEVTEAPKVELGSVVKVKHKVTNQTFEVSRRYFENNQSTLEAV